MIYSGSSPTSLSDSIVAMTVGLQYLRAAVRESVAEFCASTLDLEVCCRKVLFAFQTPGVENTLGRPLPAKVKKPEFSALERIHSVRT